MPSDLDFDRAEAEAAGETWRPGPFTDTTPAELPSHTRAKPLPRERLSLEDWLLGSAKPSPTETVSRLAERLSVTVDELHGRDRSRRIAHARKVVMWVLRQHGLSYPEIGRAVGDRDHTTAIHAVKSVEREIDRSGPRFAEALEALV